MSNGKSQRYEVFKYLLHQSVLLGGGLITGSNVTHKHTIKRTMKDCSANSTEQNLSDPGKKEHHRSV